MKNKLVKTLLCCSLLGGVGIVGAAVENNNLQAVRAEDTLVQIGVGDFKASDGTFVELPNFFSAPNVGFSFEFKITDQTVNQFGFSLYDGDTALLSNKYAWQNSLTIPSFDVYGNGTYSNVGNQLGRLVELGDGWYRYELMGYEVSMIHDISNKAATVNRIKLNGNWGAGYVNNGYMRPFKKIYNYTFAEETVAANGYVKGFAPIANWASSGYGFFIDYKHVSDNFRAALYDDFLGSTKHATNITVNGDWTYGTSGAVSGQSYLWNIGVNDHGGKVFDLGNNWYRIELMFSDVTATQATYDFNSLSLTWYGATVKNRGIIDSYSIKMNFDVEGTTTSKVMESGRVELPENPTKSGYHFVGWYEDDQFTTPFTATKITTEKTVYAKFEEHSYSVEYAWDGASCTATGTCACGDEITETKTGTQSKVSDATCTAAQQDHYSVTFDNTLLGSATSENFDNGTALGHSTTKVDGQAATCTEAGWKDYYKCSVCEDLFEDSQATTPIDDLAAWKLADGKIEATGHTLVKQDGQAATCTTDGWKDYYKCSVCNALFEDEAGQTAITELEAWKLADGKIEATGHTLVKQDGQAATCTADGWDDYYKCSVCDALFEDEAGQTAITELEAWKLADGKVEATGHTNGTPVNEDVVAPTCTEPGSHNEVIYCTVCGEKVSTTPVVDPATGHNLVKQDGQAPTCTVDGWKDYYKCSVCDALFEDAQGTTPIADLAAWKLAAGKVEATGHDYVKVEAKEATAEEAGNIEYYRCADCDTIFVLEDGVYVEKTLADVTVAYVAPEENKGGCGGSVVAVSAIASGLAFAGLALLGKKRKED